jgi:dihydroneopterin aldolase
VTILNKTPQGYIGDHLFLRGIEVLACHGVFDEERVRTQRFLIDVDWWTNAEEYARADAYDNAVCYGGVFQTVVGIVSGPPVSLIERLSIGIIDALLERYAAIRMVTVTVHKPDAPLSGQFSDVGVSCTRERARC